MVINLRSMIGSNRMKPEKGEDNIKMVSKPSYTKVLVDATKF